MRDYHATVNGIAKEFDSSMAAVRVRLQTLGRIEHRKKIRAQRDILPGSIEEFIRISQRRQDAGPTDGSGASGGMHNLG